MKQAMLCLLAFSLCLPVVATDAPKPVKIVKVLHETEPQEKDSALARTISPNDMGKFKELREDFAHKPDGEYITVVWKNSSREPLRHVSVTLSYRQTQLVPIQSDKIELETVASGTTFSRFRVIGDAFTKGGPLTAWKVDVAAEGQPLDSFHSFLWKDPS